MSKTDCLSNKCWSYHKMSYICIPFRKKVNIADVAQLARARDL